MSIEIDKVQRLRVWTESSFATDGTGTLANYSDVPFVEGTLSMSIDQEMLSPEYAQQFKDGYPTELLGLKSCTLGYTTHLASTGTLAITAVTSVQGVLGELLAATMGGESLAVGTTVAAPSSGTSFTVAEATSIADEGCAIGWVNSAGSLEARPIKTSSSTTATMRLGFSATGTTGDAIYRSATYYLTEDPTSSLQHIVQGAETDDRWLLMGQQLDSMSIDATIGQLPKVTFNFKGATWLDRTGTAGSISAAIAAATYSNISPTHFVGSAYLQDVGTATQPTALPISNITITPAIGYVPQTSPSGTQTVQRWVRNRVAPVLTGSFVVPFEDLTHWTTRNAKTLKQLLIQIGTAAGSTVLLDFPAIQITNVQRGGGTDIASATVEFKCQRDATTTGGSVMSRSAFRIHLL